MGGLTFRNSEFGIFGMTRITGQQKARQIIDLAGF